MHGYWTPEIRTPSQKLHWTVRIASRAARHFPCLCFFNREQRNVFTLAMDCLADVPMRSMDLARLLVLDRFRQPFSSPVPATQGRGGCRQNANGCRSIPSP